MGERLGQAGRRPEALFLSGIQNIRSWPKRFLVGLWRLLGLAGLLLRRLIERIARVSWAFLGRCGIAFRHILAFILWRPLLLIMQPIFDAVKRVAQEVWAFIGRCGLVLRQLLNRFIWQPLIIISSPFRWLYRKVFQRPVDFAWLSLRTFLEWLIVDLVQPAARMLPTLVLALGRRSGHSISAFGMWIQGVGQQLTEVASPALSATGLDQGVPRPRVNRFTTAIVSTSLILLLSFLTTQGSRPENVKGLQPGNPETNPALAAILPKMTLTPTATPTPLPTATPTVPPMPAVELQAWPTPDPLARGGSVAFTMRQNGNSDIYALSIGHDKPIRLTNHPADDRDPAWSPDGRHLAFASDRDGNWEIYLLDIESGLLSRLTMQEAYDGAPSWSPDGQWLVYESYREGNLDLYISPADGSNKPIRLTENQALDFSPSWSPDGRHIAFVSLRSGNKDIFIMALDSAFDEFAVNVTNTLSRSEDHPTWEPAGRALAYFDDADGLELVYTLPLEEQLPAGPAITIGQGRHPSWSPDGSSLIYAYNSDQQSYVVASSIDAWNVAPQVFAADGDLDGLTWTGLILPQGLEERFNRVDEQQDLLFVERSAPPRENEPAFLLREVSVDAPAPYLSDQVDDSFLALRQRVVEEAGWDFLAQVDNMFAFLDSRPFPGENDRSWNKAARAFDFYYRYPISIEPQAEIVREDRGTQTYWRVYLRTANQDGSQGEPLKQLPWEFSARYDSDPQYYDQGGKWKDAIPSGYYLDFTRLAADYGWTRVPAADNWRTFFQGIRYWHFENRQDLSWQEAILELYTDDELRQAYDSR